MWSNCWPSPDSIKKTNGSAHCYILLLIWILLMHLHSVLTRIRDGWTGWHGRYRREPASGGSADLLL
jgi:hypothetical protein